MHWDISNLMWFYSSMDNVTELLCWQLFGSSGRWPRFCPFRAFFYRNAVLQYYDILLHGHPACSAEISSTQIGKHLFFRCTVVSVTDVWHWGKLDHGNWIICLPSAAGGCSWRSPVVAGVKSGKVSFFSATWNTGILSEQELRGSYFKKRFEVTKILWFAHRGEQLQK